MTPDPRITIVTLGVSDLARSTAFYESVGWRLASASMDTISFFSTPAGTVLGLYGRDDLADDAGVPPEGDCRTPGGFV